METTQCTDCDHALEWTKRKPHPLLNPMWDSGELVIERTDKGFRTTGVQGYSPTLRIAQALGLLYSHNCNAD